ncbi:MAG: ABC transporter ATP-binding protein [Planctomycetota bacterium]|jgi:ABC-2 type transport system ATP-binding protein|nr:ABC transporter ATP-binding protein [Planctomycetota bacterium]
MLRITGVSKRFGSLVAVDQLEMHVPPGRVHAFLGPNGAGKTTTIKMCTGLLRPDDGSIAIDGLDVVRQGVEARRCIAYVPDEPYLYERLTGREFLDFTARIYGLDRATFAKRFDEVVEQFALADFMDQLAEGYSHGMRQRVVLAAAVLHHPKLLIVDEPLVGLDPKHIRVVLQLLREFADDGRSVLMSTHTLAAVEDVADAVTVINHGKVLFDGSVTELRGDQSIERKFLDMTDSSLRAAVVAGDEPVDND